MDTERFDALTRRLATGRPSRRRLLRGLGGSLAGAVMSGFWLREASATKGGCKAVGKHCTKAGQCCAGLVCGANGTCQRLLGGGSCPAGADSCAAGGSVSCGGVCQCFRTPEGTSACVNAQSLSCNSRGCVSSSDCPSGQACIAPFGDSCGCPFNDWICGPIC